MSKEETKKTDVKPAPHTPVPAPPPKEKKEKVTLGSIPAQAWGQKEINKVAARIEADFKLVPPRLRRRAMSLILQVLEDLTYSPEQVGQAVKGQVTDERQVDLEGALREKAADRATKVAGDLNHRI